MTPSVSQFADLFRSAVEEPGASTSTYSASRGIFQLGTARLVHPRRREPVGGVAGGGGACAATSRSFRWGGSPTPSLPPEATARRLWKRRTWPTRSTSSAHPFGT